MKFGQLYKIVAIVFLGFTCGTALAVAQSYPDKPIRVVTAEPGGGNDIAARLIAQEITLPLGQRIVVDNRGGASGAIAAEIVARAPADGYTLLLFGNNIWLLPFMRKVTYDPLRDFAPITMAIQSPTLLVLHPSVPAATAKDLIALAKAKPGVLNYGSAATGGAAHLAAELFKAMAGVDIVRVAYKGTPQAVNELIAGQLQVMFVVVAAGMQHVKAGRLKALGVTSAQPSALAPGFPTVAATGLPGYEAGTTIGVFAPAHTPPAVVERLNREIVKALSKPAIKEKFLNAGAEVVGSSPQQTSAMVKFDMDRMGKVIREAGIRDE